MCLSRWLHCDPVREGNLFGWIRSIILVLGRKLRDFFSNLWKWIVVILLKHSNEYFNYLECLLLRKDVIFNWLNFGFLAHNLWFDCLLFINFILIICNAIIGLCLLLQSLSLILLYQLRMNPLNSLSIIFYRLYLAHICHEF